MSCYNIINKTPQVTERRRLGNFGTCTFLVVPL